MDGSALPYLYSFVVDLFLILIGGFVGWKQRRQILLYTMAWLAVDAIRCFLIIASAGEYGLIDRLTVVWLIRAAWVLQTTILIASVGPFLKENVKF